MANVGEDLDDYDDSEYGRRAEAWPHSGIGVASFITGIPALLLGVPNCAVVELMAAFHPATVTSACRLVIGAGVVALLGTGLGICAVCQSQRKKVFAVIGLCMNGLILLWVIEVLKRVMAWLS